MCRNDPISYEIEQCKLMYGVKTAGIEFLCANIPHLILAAECVTGRVIYLYDCAETCDLPTINSCKEDPSLDMSFETS